jgi:hypothetical protein
MGIFMETYRPGRRRFKLGVRFLVRHLKYPSSPLKLTFVLWVSTRLTPPEAHEFHLSVRILSARVTMWPSPRESLIEGQKLETFYLINKCALSLGYQQPVVFAVPNDKLEFYITEICSGALDAVLKRTNSGCSHHVITRHTKNPKDVIAKALEELKQWRVAGHSFGEPVWICQPYLPHLLHIGEYRTFTVNGTIYYTAATTPIELDPQTLDMVGGRMPRPLETYQYVALSLSAILPPHLLDTTPKAPAILDGSLWTATMRSVSILSRLTTVVPMKNMFWRCWGRWSRRRKRSMVRFPVSGYSDGGTSLYFDIKAAVSMNTL